MDHFSVTQMETNPLLIPADPFEAIINEELVQSAELKSFAGWNRIFMERLEIWYANQPFVRCLFEAEKVFLSLKRHCSFFDVIFKSQQSCGCKLCERFEPSGERRSLNAWSDKGQQFPPITNPINTIRGKITASIDMSVGGLFTKDELRLLIGQYDRKWYTQTYTACTICHSAEAS